MPGDQVGGLHRQVGDLSRASRGSRPGPATSPPTKCWNVVISWSSCLSRLPTWSSTALRLVIRLADHLVAARPASGHRGGVREQAVEGAALALEDLDDLVGELVDVGRRERLRTAA